MDENRLQQVWFTGMHADVGGGYPDESLSYVSLLWMMEEAERAGLRTLTVIKDRFVALASSFGPIHDSRAGVGAYYRYQPRKIAAWLDPVDSRTLSLRDPAITDDRGRSRGLLRSVKVHESVINRIATGTDRYAPITLPKTFDIVPPQVEGENAPASRQSDARASRARARSEIDARPRVSRGWRTGGCRRSRGAIEPIWNLVWWRRIIYFATLAATLLLLSLPLLARLLPRPPLLTDGRTWIGGVIRLLTVVLPSFAGEWVEVYADNPFYFLLLAGVIWLLLAFGTRMERRASRRRPAGVAARTGGCGRRGASPSWLQTFRNSRRYQRFVQGFKWYFLPDWVVTPLTVAAVRLDCLRGVHADGAAVSGKWHRVVPAVARRRRGDRPRRSRFPHAGRLQRELRPGAARGSATSSPSMSARPWYDATLPPARKVSPPGSSRGDSAIWRARSNG